jgi:hypothetical protein
VFFFVGRPLLDRLGPAGAAILVAAAGCVRWAIMALTAWLPTMAAIELEEVRRRVQELRATLDPVRLHSKFVRPSSSSLISQMGPPSGKLRNLSRRHWSNSSQGCAWQEG